MAAPTWTTEAGDLGTIQEAEFYTFQLIASDSDSEDQSSLSPGIVFTLQAGVLPTGLRLSSTGVVDGLPSTTTYVSGVPSDVGEDVTSRFVVRATSTDIIISDRTFELTVSGQDAPTFLIDSGSLGTYRDAEFVDVTVTATDADPDDTLVFSITSGELPGGVTIDSSGRISGYIEPSPLLTGTPGFDTDDVPFDTNTFDFRTQAENKTYEFTVSVSDGKDFTARAYSIFVYAANTFSADTDLLTADGADYPLTADQTTLRTPVLLTEAGDLGLVTHDNYFAYQFFGKDFDGDPFQYSLGVGSTQGFDNDSGFDSEVNGFDQGDLAIPPGLQLDPDTGWLYGYIPNQSATQTEYNFTVRVLKTNNTSYISEWKFFSMTIVGDIRSVVTWLTDSDLGTIKVGQVSTLAIETTNTLGKSVSYKLKPGSNSRLPQGLKLQEDGLLVGRPSFQTMMFDGGTTSFDKNHPVLNETTFELDHTFIVQINDTDGDIQTSKTFTLTVDPRNFKPYENLWAKAYPSVAQREIWESLINSPDDFPPDLIYRESDYWFGKRQDMRILLTTGLNPLEANEYISAMATHHYNKRVTIGELKKARAVVDGVVVYEVIYADAVDRETSNGVSTASSIDFLSNHDNDWSNPETVDQTSISVDSGVVTADQQDQYTFYPNSFENMNSGIIDDIGQHELEELPLWMTSKQEDGSILGFVPAIVITFTLPGNADEIIFNINRRTDIDLKKIEFIIDRYIWDSDMSENYDKTYGTGDDSTVSAPRWIPSQETTFDIDDTQTVYDVDSTRFRQNSFKYKEELDDGDAFLKFPQSDIDG